MLSELSIEQVIATYTPTVYGVALTHTASRTDADDVFQEVFCAYWRSRPNVSSEEHRKAWLIRTTLNFCLKATQSSWAKRTAYVDGAMSEEKDNEFFSSRNSVNRGCDNDSCLIEDQYTDAFNNEIELPSADFPFLTEQQSALYEAIRTLSTPYRTVVQLFYFEDLSVAQIAATLGEEQGAVKTRLSRARAQLREKLKEGA